MDGSPRFAAGPCLQFPQCPFVFLIKRGPLAFDFGLPAFHFRLISLNSSLIRLTRVCCRVFTARPFLCRSWWR